MFGAIFGVIGNVVGALAKPVASVIKSKQETKQKRIETEAKVTTAKISGQKDITLTDQEWEAIMASKTDSTWKDEYLTIVITSPILLIIIGGISSVFGYPQVLDGITLSMDKLAGTGIDMGFLMEAVVLAGVGLKVLKNTLKI